MNYLAAFILFLSASSIEQPIALLDRNFKAPVAYTNKVTLETFSKPVFPLYREDVAGIITTVGGLRKKIAQNNFLSAEMDSVRLGHSVLMVETKIGDYKRTYNITISTQANGFTTYLELVAGDYDRFAQQRIVLFLDYLESSRSGD
jgi:hypothetical protein